MPILDRNDVPVYWATRQRVLLDVGEPCNTALNARFEVQAKPVVSELALSGWSGSHTEEEWRAVGMCRRSC